MLNQQMQWYKKPFEKFVVLNYRQMDGKKTNRGL